MCLNRQTVTPLIHTSPSPLKNMPQPRSRCDRSTRHFDGMHAREYLVLVRNSVAPACYRDHLRPERRRDKLCRVLRRVRLPLDERSYCGTVAAVESLVRHQKIGVCHKRQHTERVARCSSALVTYSDSRRRHKAKSYYPSLFSSCDVLTRA